MRLVELIIMPLRLWPVYIPNLYILNFYTVWGLQGPKFQIFTAKFYKPLFRFILPKNAHFSKSFGCLAASKQTLYIVIEFVH